MNDNLHIENILDDLIGNKVSRSEAIDLLAKENVSDARVEIDLHLCAVNAIRRYNTLLQVQSIHNNFIATRNNDKSKEKSSKIVAGKFSPFKWIVTIAASALLIISSWFFYQFSNTDSTTLYGEIYQPYSINTDRGMGEIRTHRMVEEFKQKNYAAVIKIFESFSATNNREKFLAGYAYHEIGNYKQSIVNFEEILSYNQKTGTRLYNDEAEFYSGLTYLKLNDNSSASKIFESIAKNPNHTFYERISKWTITRLRWIK